MRTSTTSMNVRRKLPKNSSRYIQLLQVIIVGKFGLTHNFTHNFTQLYPLLRPTLPSFTQLYPLLHTTLPLHPTLPITSHNATHYFTQLYPLLHTTLPITSLQMKDLQTLFKKGHILSMISSYCSPQ